eukprot:SAG11_NODE_357_length_10240_cov_4.621142_2_plen_119_part_00
MVKSNLGINLVTKLVTKFSTCKLAVARYKARRHIKTNKYGITAHRQHNGGSDFICFIRTTICDVGMLQHTGDSGLAWVGFGDVGDAHEEEPSPAGQSTEFDLHTTAAARLSASSDRRV